MSTMTDDRPASAPHDDPEPKAAEPEVSLGERIHSWLAHPLLLLVIGALVTGVLVPSFTNRWQRNQTAQAMKTEAIGDVTDAVSMPMTQLSVTQNPVFAASGANVDRGAVASTYASFLTKSDAVDSTLKAYFPGNNIPTHWENLSGLLQNFYLSTYATDNGLKANFAQHVKQYFQAHHAAGGVNWTLLATGHWGIPGYYRTWLTVKTMILGVKSIVLSDIMDSPAPNF